MPTQQRPSRALYIYIMIYTGIHLRRTICVSKEAMERLPLSNPEGSLMACPQPYRSLMMSAQHFEPGDFTFPHHTKQSWYFSNASSALTSDAEPNRSSTYIYTDFLYFYYIVNLLSTINPGELSNIITSLSYYITIIEDQFHIKFIVELNYSSFQKQDIKQLLQYASVILSYIQCYQLYPTLQVQLCIQTQIYLLQLTLRVRVEPLELQRELPVSTCIILCTHRWQRTQKLIFHSMKLMMFNTGILKVINRNRFNFSFRYLGSGCNHLLYQLYYLLHLYYYLQFQHSIQSRLMRRKFGPAQFILQCQDNFDVVEDNLSSIGTILPYASQCIIFRPSTGSS
ncbi:Hypothetical_protein [Hexamita inflata]|uniref:Hypothetical_protein n=1 Tax=Hexamita inflata TaxID=28002 RepID=A0ABP1HPD7_9EUKA